MSSIYTVALPITTTGSAGSATGSATTSTLHGFLLDIYLDFSGAPSTTDTTIAYASRGGNILVVTSSSTDALIAPRVKVVDNANTAITNSFERFTLNDAITVSLAQADALDPALTVYLRILRP